MEKYVCVCQICGEELSVDFNAVDLFKTELGDVLQGFTKEQIFNADETGFNF